MLSLLKEMVRGICRGWKLATKYLATMLRGYRSAARVNLCSGRQTIPGYTSVDFGGVAEIKLDLSKNDLPFKSGSVKSVVCISAINYFTRSRADEIVREIFRVLEPGGIARFGVQDMESIAKRYVEKDVDFFFQKLPDGRERFEGQTLGDKFAAWFYGYMAVGPCRYFYDYDSLAYLFKTAGFAIVEKKQYRESRLEHIELIDNRPDQMFFLEAIK
jgi:predicted SAM-dependent methyltransferase